MPRLGARGEAFEILWEYKRGDLDIGEAYDLIYDEIRRRGRSRRRSPSRNRSTRARAPPRRSTKPRKLSSWQKYIKNKRNHIKLRSGKLNLKKMAVQFRKTKAGKKKK